jgi:hypothetical protein
MGSPFYMSPEQIASPQSVDARSDIWSLGVVLHRLLTGSLPFYGDTVLEIYERVMRAAPSRVTDLRPGVDPALDAVVLRCLEKEPARRYSSIDELIRELEPCAARARCNDTAPSRAALPSIVDDTPIEIPMVRSRWPATLAIVVAMTCGAMWEASGCGPARASDSDHARFSPEHLVDTPVRVPWETTPPLFGPALGTYAVDVALDPDGEPVVRAETERKVASRPRTRAVEESGPPTGRRRPTLLMQIAAQIRHAPAPGALLHPGLPKPPRR